MAEDELPVFDGVGSDYGWSILAWQFWNGRGYNTPIWLTAPRTRSADIVTLQTLDSYSSPGDTQRKELKPPKSLDISNIQHASPLSKLEPAPEKSQIHTE
ncbi:hypothetical protein PIB30_071500 [Stylosanthes scabra]|uniref:Uncharacterized protein n=1 Tax=Stylosanthes scabra TaxID=79078 RepID=A0ABU6UN56_9FABA|nr:hypothetical protein [Stylosanthes scabra]